MSADLFKALNNCVIVSPEGEFFRFNSSISRVGIRDDLLLKAAGEAAGVPIADFHHLAIDGDRCPVHLYSSAQPAIAVRIKSIRLNTRWTVTVDESGNPIIVPIFSTNQGIERTLVWRLPEDGAFYFVTRQNIQYFVGIGARDGKFEARRLDLPNIFDEGKICMGPSWVESEREFAAGKKSKVEMFAHSLNWWSMTVWNTHLMDEGKIRSAQELIRFAPDGAQRPIKTGDSWLDHSKLVAHSAYNWLVALHAARGSLL
jgi:hypothetical protein